MPLAGASGTKLRCTWFLQHSVLPEAVMRHRPIVAAAALSGLLLSAPLSAQQPKEGEPPLGTASFTPPTATEEAPLSPESFVVRAAITNMAEIELGKLALSRSTDTNVQAYARKMIDEHARAQEALKKAAGEAKIAMPATVDDKHRKLQQKLAALGGRDFDQEYAKAMAAGHDDAVALFDGATHAKNMPPSLQTFASRTLPIVRQHRDAAQHLYSSHPG
jgi:putative membrane protein